jgi:Ca2+-binding RTX toxin-like protein
MNKIGTHKSESLVGDNEVNLLDGNLGNDTLLGGAANDVLHGGSDYPGSAEDFVTGVGHDWLEGRGGNDNLNGGYGNDTLIGGEGDDLLDGGDWTTLNNDFYDGIELFVSDSLVGGTGNDTYIVDSAVDVVVEFAGEGIDEVRSSVSYTLAAHVENLMLTGADAIDGTGNELGNNLTGNAAANRLDGGAGSDTLTGGVGTDTLLGGSGNDTLVDGVGATFAQGGDGSDVVVLDWSSLSGATFATSNVSKSGSSYSGTYQAKNAGGTVISSVAFSSIEKLIVSGKQVDLNPPADPGVKISRSSTATATTETGGTVQYSIALAAAPFEDVTIQFTSSDSTEGVVTTPSLTFTKQNWNTPQTLTIQGVDDYLNDSNVAYTINGKVVTSDLTYNRVEVPAINLLNNDDGLDNDREIYGTIKTDYLEGANGSDRIYGAGGQDQLKGGRGNDRLYGQEDNDRLFGELGDDELYGGYDDDTLDGGDGNDSLFGEQGRDTLLGGLGNDYLDGGLLNDSMSGGIGNDTYIVDSAGDQINDLGATSDVDVVQVIQTISYTLPANIENAAITASGNGNLTGNALNNGLIGNDGKNILDGGVGNDNLDGGAGADSLLGGVGNDEFNGGAGNDTMRGGEGVDLADFAAAGVDISIDLTTGKAKGEGTDLLFDIENILAGEGDDTLTGSSTANDLDGGAGTDNLNGGAGNDTLSGCFYGSNGGKGEIDTLVGGADVDVFQLGWASGRFYDDGNTKNAGRGDYVVISDFTVGQDKLQLDGSASGYYLAASGVTGVSGIGLYAEQGATDELIAIIRSANSTVLNVANTVNTAVFV